MSFWQFRKRFAKLDAYQIDQSTIAPTVARRRLQKFADFDDVGDVAYFKTRFQPWI